MDREEKQRIFEPLLRDFETETFAEYFRDMVAEIPDYIFTIPSSTSGKYHNATQCEKFGQIYHEYMFASILNHRLRLKANREKYNTQEIRDCMRCVPVFHDAVKCGWNGSRYTVSEHPMLAAEWVRTTSVEHDIDSQYKEMIACMCEAHSGEWNKNRSGEEIMPEPRNDMEFFIHECDILSSRADLDMIISDELKEILSGEKVAEKEMSLEEYRVDFGKYSGKTLLEIRDLDPGYIRWMKEKVDREPVRTLLMQM